MDAEERVARRARRQKGLITHRQCLDRGMSHATIHRRVATGAWLEIRRGVYIVGGAPPSWEQTLLAVTLPFEDCWIDFAIELQSWDWHGGREPFDDDKARMSDLTAIGWRTLEITSRHSPEDIVRWITGAITHSSVA